MDKDAVRWGLRLSESASGGVMFVLDTVLLLFMTVRGRLAPSLQGPRRPTFDRIARKIRDFSLRRPEERRDW